MEENSLRDLSAALPRATVTSGSAEAPGEALEQVRRSAGGSFSQSLLGQLQLVRDTPVGDLGELLLEIEISPGLPILWGEGGGIVERTIVERMMAEDPDALLQLAASGKSTHLWQNQSAISAKLFNHFGYEMVEAKLDEARYPGSAAAVKAGVLKELFERDPDRAFGHLQGDQRLVSDTSLWREVPETMRDEAVLNGTAPGSIREFFVGGALGRLYVENPEAAVAKLAGLERTKDRAAALDGIAGHWQGSIAEAEEFAGGLGPHQLQLNFMRRALQSSGRRKNSKEYELDAALELSESPVRHNLLVEDLRTWKTLQPEAARTWAEANGLIEMFDAVSPQKKQGMRR